MTSQETNDVTRRAISLQSEKAKAAWFQLRHLEMSLGQRNQPQFTQRLEPRCGSHTLEASLENAFPKHEINEPLGHACGTCRLSGGLFYFFY